MMDNCLEATDHIYSSIHNYLGKSNRREAIHINEIVNMINN